MIIIIHIGNKTRELTSAQEMGRVYFVLHWNSVENKYFFDVTPVKQSQRWFFPCLQLHQWCVYERMETAEADGTVFMGLILGAEWRNQSVFVFVPTG